MCQKFLGEATIQYKFVGCAIGPENLSRDQGQASVRESYLVPAHHLEVRVTNIAGHDRARDLFLNSPIMNDLTHINEVETETSTAAELVGEGAEDPASELTLFRFVYPVRVIIHIQIKSHYTFQPNLSD